MNILIYVFDLFCYTGFGLYILKKIAYEGENEQMVYNDEKNSYVANGIKLGEVIQDVYYDNYRSAIRLFIQSFNSKLQKF